MDEKFLSEFSKTGLVCIFRHISTTDALPAAQALYTGGIRLFEVAFDHNRDAKDNNTPEIISIFKKKLPGDVLIGAGTVITLNDVQTAYNAGADFILAPDTNIEIIHSVKKLGMAMIPGAATPTEMNVAYQNGAAMVKFFPAGVLGNSYYRAVKAPLGDIPVMAVGDINEMNIPSFLAEGIRGFGIGSNLVKKEAIKNKDFVALTRTAERYLSIIRENRGPESLNS